LIQKWLNAGVLEEGKLTVSEQGTPQGGSASPLLANVLSSLIRRGPLRSSYLAHLGSGILHHRSVFGFMSF